MSNESTLMIETEIAIPINVADGTGIPKGTSLKLADLFVGAASTAADETFACITKEEKIADDGKTKVAGYFGGIFKVIVGAAGATKGFNAALSGANLFVNADANDIDEGLVAGKFLETGTSGESVLMFLGKF